MLKFLSFFKTTPKESSAKAIFKEYLSFGWGEADFLSYLIQQGIPFDEPLNEQNESILHLLVKLSTLEDFVDYLQRFPLRNLNPKNRNGQTPLDLAMSLEKHCFTQHLLFIGAKCAESDLEQSLSRLSLSSSHSNHDAWQAQDMSEKARVLRLFKNICVPTYDAFVLIIATCHVLHLELSGPFDENNNSLLHLFIEHGYPTMIIDLFLNHCTRKDIKTKNLDGCTPLMLAMVKHELSTQQVLQLHEGLPYRATSPVYSSVAFKLIEQIEADLSKHVGAKTPKKTAEIIFNSFVDYIKTAKWVYDPEANYSHSLLLLPANEPHVGDCICIANALLIMFHAHGLFDIISYILEPEPNEDAIQMPVPPLKKPGIIGTYNCFDTDKQQAMIKDGYVIFGMHKILRRSDEPFFYDPVFSCCYAGEQAIPLIQNSALLQKSSVFVPLLKAQKSSDDDRSAGMAMAALPQGLRL